jgi:hypothetical protein
VQIVEREQDGPLGRGLLEQDPHGLERAVALAGGVAGFVARPERGQQPRERTVADPLLALDRRQRGEMALERLDPRLIRQQPVLVAAPEQHGGALGVNTSGELAEQRRLSDPGLAGRDGDPQGPRRRVRPGGAQPGERRLAPLGPGRPGQRRGQRQLRRRSAALDPSAPHRLDQRPRLGRRRDAQLAPQPLGQRVGRGQRRGAVAGEREQADQVAVPRLAERLVLAARTSPADRLGHAARVLGAAGEGRQHAGELVLVLVAGPHRPVGIEPAQELAARERGAGLELGGGAELGQVDLRAQLDGLARGDHRLGRRQGAAQLVDRVTQRLAGARLGHVRPQKARQPRARVRAGVDGEVGEQLAGTGVGGEGDRRSGNRCGKAAEDADENLMGQSC